MKLHLRGIAYCGEKGGQRLFTVTALPRFAVDIVIHIFTAFQFYYVQSTSTHLSLALIIGVN